jgi:hypothetical protein
MSSKFSIASFALRTVSAGAISAVSYLFVLSALRPDTPLFQQVSVTEPENYFAICIAAIIFVAVFWRLMRGSKISDEVSRVLDADGD